MSDPLVTLEGTAAALPLRNVDTDMILPSRFMKTVRRTGLGNALFHGLRFDEEGRERTEFVLNRPDWRRAVFLVSRDNFGCGSSREHAPWALLDFGIRCILAPRFADIFQSNCSKNGILTARVDESFGEELLAEAADPKSARFHLDLPAQRISTASGLTGQFDVTPESKRRLLNGLDDIAETMSQASAIASHDAAVGFPRPVIPTSARALAEALAVQPIAT